MPQPRRLGPRAPHGGRGGPPRSGAAEAFFGKMQRALARQGHHHRPLGDDGGSAAGGAGALSGGIPSRDPGALGRRETGAPGVLGNRAASGTVILDELGAEHVRTGKPIVYTSADSVLQMAAHEEAVPLERSMIFAVDRAAAPRPFRGGAGHCPAVRGRSRASTGAPTTAGTSPSRPPERTSAGAPRGARRAGGEAWARSRTSSTARGDHR